MGQPLVSQRLNDFATRALTGAVFVTVVVLACTLFNQYSMYLFLFFGIACLYEWARMSGGTWDRYLTSFGYFAAFFLGQYVVKHVTSPGFADASSLTLRDLSIYTGIILAFALFDIGLAAVLKRGKMARLLLNCLVGLCIAYAFFTACFFSYLEMVNGPRGFGIIHFNSLLLIFLVVWVTDTAAYLVGNWIGGRKLAPAISPNKTWSGLIGGVLVTGLIVGMLAMLGLFKVNNSYTVTREIVVVMLSMAASITAQMGDLLQSKLKRIYGVKDSGSLLPGHGGFFDRLDSFILLTFLWGLFWAALDPYNILIYWSAAWMR